MIHFASEFAIAQIAGKKAVRPSRSTPSGRGISLNTWAKHPNFEVSTSVLAVGRTSFLSMIERPKSNSEPCQTHRHLSRRAMSSGSSAASPGCGRSTELSSTKRTESDRNHKPSCLGLQPALRGIQRNAFIEAASHLPSTLLGRIHRLLVALVAIALGVLALVARLTAAVYRRAKRS